MGEYADDEIDRYIDDWSWRDTFWHRRYPAKRERTPPAKAEDFPLLDENVADALRRTFGYAPDEANGERWVVYEDRLLVIHPERRPRVYRRGWTGPNDFYEIELLP